MITHAELNGLRELANQRAHAMSSERLMILAAELSLLERCMEHSGATGGEIAAAKFRHAASNEAGAWAFDFVRPLVRLGLAELGGSALGTVPASVLIPLLIDGEAAARREAVEARRRLVVLADFVARTRGTFVLPEAVAQIVDNHGSARIGTDGNHEGTRRDTNCGGVGHAKG